MNGSKRRKRGPRASAYFSFESDEPVPVPSHTMGQASAHVSAPGASCASLPNTRGGAEMNGSRSGSDGGAELIAPHVLPVMVPPVPSLGGGDVDVDEGESSPSASTTDTEFSSPSEKDSANFSSRRELLCYGYLYGRARLSIRQYDIMRSVENSFSSTEKWLSRWRLQQVRAKLLLAAAPVKKQVTSRQFPSGKGKSPRTRPDVVVTYTTFSEHVRRDFADSLTAAIFHDEGDALLGTVESPTEIFQTVAATDPGRYNFRRQIRLDGRLYALGDIVSMAISASVRLKAKLQSTGMAIDGEVSLSPSEYASGRALRVGDLTATFMLTEDSARPALLSLCLTGNGTFTARFTRCGSIHAMRVLGVKEGAPIAWNAVSTVSSMKVDVAVVREDTQLVSKDPYKIFVSWYGDQYGTMKRRRGDVEGHYGAYTSVSLDFRSSTVRPLFYLPPGAASAPLIAAVVKDLCHASKTGITVYDAFTVRNALVHIYPAAGIFDSPMAAKLSNTIGATGVEHCTSCDIVGLKTTSERKDRAMSSATVFDVRDTR